MCCRLKVQWLSTAALLMAITRSQASLSVWPMSIHQLSIGQIKSHSHTQCQWKEVSSPHCKSTWHKEKLTPIPLKFFPKIEEEEILQNSFYSDTKTRQRHWKKITDQYLWGMLMQKSSKKTLANRNNSISNRLYAMTKWDAFLECKDGSTIENESMKYATLTK